MRWGKSMCYFGLKQYKYGYNFLRFIVYASLTDYPQPIRIDLNE